MNKQTVQNTDPTSNLEAGRVTKSNLDTSSRRYKVVLIVSGILATVVLSTVVAITVGLLLTPKLHTKTSEYDRKYHGDSAEVNIMEDSDQLFMNEASAALKTVAKRQTNNGVSLQGCYSEKSSKTYPAARIAGRGFKWTTDEPGSQNIPQVSGYQSFWVCANRSGAFVDGGMFFSHKTRKLTVPTCGYYQVSSHVLFQSERSTTATINASKYVRHELIIKKNCNYAHESDTVILRSYSSIVSTSASYGRTSTHIGDIVKMCEGGTILVNIPSDSSNPCCPYGRSQSTYLSAYMVTNTSCDPSISMDRPPLS